MPTTKKDTSEEKKQEEEVVEAPVVSMKAEVVEDEDGRAESLAVDQSVAGTKPSSVNPHSDASEELESEENEKVEATIDQPTMVQSVQPAVTPAETPELPSQPTTSLMDATATVAMGEQVDARGAGLGSSGGMVGAEVVKGGKNKKMLVVGVVLLVVVLIALGLVVWQRTKLSEMMFGNKDAEVEVGEEVVQPEVTPTPEPEVVGLERGEITVDVLNGSGVTGAAGVLAESLEELGYEVGEVGNAEETEGNELYVQEELEEQLEVLLEDLRDVLGIEGVTGYLEEGEATARVVLGVEVEEEAVEESGEAEEEIVE